MKRKLMILSLVLVMFIAIGTSFAFYLPKVIGNEDIKSNYNKTDYLELSYETGKFVNGKISKPGDKITTEFTVENTSSNVEIKSYDVYFSDVYNELLYKDYLKYTVKCEVYLSDNKVSSCTGIENVKVAPSTTTLMLVGDAIKPGYTHKYTLTLIYENGNFDQSLDIGKKYSMDVTVIDSYKSLAGEIINSAGGVKNIYDRGTPNYSKNDPEILYGDVTSKITTTKLNDINLFSSDYVYRDGKFILSGSIVKKDIINSYYCEDNNDVCETLYKVNSQNNDIYNVTKYYAKKSYDKTNINKMYVTRDQDGNTYYYRGLVNNNYVSFSGMLFRVIRINGDGTIRLMLDEYASKNNSKYSIQYNNCNDIKCASYNNSILMRNVNEWFKNNVKNEYLDYVATSKYCNDYTYKGNTTNASYKINNYIPSLDCTANLEYSSMPETLLLNVGVLSSDEVLMYGNVLNSWTMSLSKKAQIFNSLLESTDITSKNHFIPVINLKSDTRVLGSGTENDPYVLVGITNKTLKNTILDNYGGELYINKNADDSSLKVKNTKSGKTYYFTGENSENYVKFSGLIWRIVRINESGSIRLVLNTPMKDKAGVIYNIAYNSDCKSKCTEYENSTISKVLDNWYSENIDNNIVVNDVFDNDGNELLLNIGLLTSTELNDLNISSINTLTMTSSDNKIITASGNLETNAVSNVYPVINVRSDISVSGTGSINNPYVIE